MSKVAARNCGDSLKNRKAEIIMTPSQITVVQASWQKVAKHQEDVATVFYQRLFELAPELRQFYQSDIQQFGRSLMRNLDLAVTSLGQFKLLMPMLSDFATKNLGSGIKNKDETAARNAMLWTLERCLADSFTQEVRTAWNEAFSLLTGAVQRGMSASLVGEFTD